MFMPKELPKCPVCGSTSEYTLSGIFGKYATCQDCMTKWKLTIKNLRITDLTLHEPPKNGAGLFKVKRTGLPLFVEKGKLHNADFWKNLELDGEIDWEFLSKTVDKTVCNFFIKNDAETLLYSWTGSYDTGEMQYPKGTVLNVPIYDHGSLLLTNQRLIFFKKPMTKVVLEILLENIKGISGIMVSSTTFLSVFDGKKENTFSLKKPILN
jgi:hypothetical protein